VRDSIHFAHGNGFPSSCYRQLFQVLESRYDCRYIDRIGHNPRFPVTENWDYLVDELIASIREKFSQPVIGLGHSLGGVLNLLAAIKEPSLFKGVVMLDSPLLGRFKSSMVRLAKSIGLIDKLTPALRTRGRRHHWNTREELTHYLKGRPLFRTFSEECLQDYINFGFKKMEDGYWLHFDKQVEYLIFRTLPHHLPRYEGKLTIPTALIYGDKSTVVTRFDVRYMRNKYHINCYRVPGTHMLPMENPSMVGMHIFQALDNLAMDTH
jgi:pimeloyl-ACP methyl ester carboxylesterase